MSDARIEVDAKNITGESLVWDERRGRLAWVDIPAKRIHTLVLADGEHQTYDPPDFATSIGLREDGGAVVGLLQRVALWDWGDDWQTLAPIEPDKPDNRLNEGKVGPDGAYWVGTMQNNIAADGTPMKITGKTGGLYRVSPNGSLTRLTEDVFGITNTMVWPDDHTLIIGDTTENALYRYTVGEDGRLGRRQPFFEGYERGLPDGSCKDSEGFVWNCRVVGGSCVARIAPDGRLDRVVDIPVSWPTSCAFGGDALDRLFVTSARFTMTEEHLAANPQEGALISVDVGVSGNLEHRFGPR